MCQQHSSKDKVFKYVKYAILPCVFAGLFLSVPKKASASPFCDDYVGAEVRLKVPSIGARIIESFETKDVCTFRVLYWTNQRYLELRMIDIKMAKKDLSK